MTPEWPVVPVEQVCDLIVDCVNKTAPVTSQKTPYRMIRTTNVRNGRIDLGDCKYVAKATFEKWTRRAKLRCGDVVLTREAPIGEVGLVAEADGVFLGQRLMQYRANRELIYPRFLLYTFLSPALQYQFRSHEGSGSVVSHIRVGDCFKFKLSVPPVSVQRDIVALLSALDDRIDLLRQTNTTLEAIAQALFKSWFVDFDPVRAKAEGRGPEDMDAATAALFPSEFEGSELGQSPKGWCASQFGNVLTETSDRVKERATTVMSAVQTGNLVKSDDHFNKRVHSADISKYKLVPPLSFAYNPSRINIGSIGLNESNGLGAVSPIYVVAKPRSKDIAYLIWHHLRERRTKSAIETLCSGSVRQSLSPKDFMSLPLVLPDSDTLTRFMGIRRALYQKVVAGSEQIASLAGLRDTLLPRLISGKLRLPEASEAAEAALA